MDSSLIRTDKRLLESVLYGDLGLDRRNNPGLCNRLEDPAWQAKNQAGTYYQQLLDAPSHLPRLPISSRWQILWKTTSRDVDIHGPRATASQVFCSHRSRPYGVSSTAPQCALSSNIQRGSKTQGIFNVASRGLIMLLDSLSKPFITSCVFTSSNNS